MYSRVNGIRDYYQAIMALAITCQVIAVLGEMPNNRSRRLGAIYEPRLDEISGIIVSSVNKDTVWVADDGKSERIFGTSFQGNVKCEIEFAGKVNDIEDLTYTLSPEDQSYLVVGDSGDNKLKRKYIQLIAIKEPVLNSSKTPKLEITPQYRSRIYYPDKVYDSEAIAWDPRSGNFFVFSKEKNGSTVFSVSGDDFWSGKPDILARKMCRVSASKVSAGDISRDGKWILLRNEKIGSIWNLSAGSLENSLAKHPFSRLPVKGKDQAKNGEAIGFTPSADGYITISEGRNQPLYLFDINLND